MDTKLKVLILGLALAAGLYKAYSLGSDHKDLEWQAKWSEHKLEDSRNASTAQDAHAKRTEGLNVVREEQEKAHVVGVSDLRSRVSDLSRVAEGLRSELATTTARLHTAEQAARNASVNATATKTAMVLSDMLGKTTRQLELVSSTADEWRLNAEGCHAFYEKIREQ